MYIQSESSSKYKTAQRQSTVDREPQNSDWDHKNMCGYWTVQLRDAVDDIRLNCKWGQFVQCGEEECKIKGIPFDSGWRCFRTMQLLLQNWWMLKVKIQSQSQVNKPVRLRAGKPAKGNFSCGSRMRCSCSHLYLYAKSFPTRTKASVNWHSLTSEHVIRPLQLQPPAFFPASQYSGPGMPLVTREGIWPLSKTKNHYLSVLRIHGLYVHRGRFNVKLMQGPSLARAPSKALGRALAMRSHGQMCL
jgi:hypothetical protein